MPALGSVEAQDIKRRRLRAEPRPDRDLAAYLRSEYAAGLPMAISSRDASATGRQISDRIVSRLEVDLALRALPWRQRRVIELRCVEDLPVQVVAQRLAIDTSTVYRDQERALLAMVQRIYEWL